jgi:hypothetical protein
MKAIIEIYKHGEHEVELSYSNGFSGYGHHNIFCEVYYKGKKKSFKITTSDMPWIDSLSEFRFEENPSLEQLNQFFHDKWFDYSFEERIADWIYQNLEDDQN